MVSLFGANDTDFACLKQKPEVSFWGNKFPLLHMASPAPFQEPALWAASLQGLTAEVRWLLSDGRGDIEERGGVLKFTPLLAAASEGHRAIAQLLLEAGADLKATSSRGVTSLHAAASHASQGHEDVAVLLIQHGAEVSAKDGNGWTAMHAASQTGQHATVLLLLENGAEVSAKENAGWTSLHVAAGYGHASVVGLLLEHGSEMHSKINGGGTPLHSAALNGHDAVVSQLLKKGAVMSAKEDGTTPLHLAASEGHTVVVRLLLDSGADVLSKTHTGSTAEDVATARSHLQTVAMLKAEAIRRAQCEAFAMGHDERLGAGSRVRWLDAGVVRMVLEQV